MFVILRNADLEVGGKYEKNNSWCSFLFVWFFSVLLIRLSSINNPVGSWSNQTRFEAFLEEWNIEILYQLSIWLVYIGVILIIIEPVLIIHKYIKKSVKN